MQDAVQVLALFAALAVATPARAQATAAPPAPPSNAAPTPTPSAKAADALPAPSAQAPDALPSPSAKAADALPTPAPPPADEIHAVQKRPLREAHRLELWAYGVGSIGDPYQQRWGGGLRAMFHPREGLSFGLDARGLGTFATEDLVIAKRELHAQILESHERASLSAVAAVAPLYGKVALPGDLLLHFETFADVGLGAAETETASGRGVRPLISAGVGQRLFTGDDVALTLRLGGELYAERFAIAGQPQTKAMGFWTLAFGVAFYLPGQRGGEP